MCWEDSWSITTLIHSVLKIAFCGKSTIHAIILGRPGLSYLAIFSARFLRGGLSPSQYLPTPYYSLSIRCVELCRVYLQLHAIRPPGPEERHVLLYSFLPPPSSTRFLRSGRHRQHHLIASNLIFIGLFMLKFYLVRSACLFLEFPFAKKSYTLQGATH